MHIPTHSGERFRSIPANDSDSFRRWIPNHSGSDKRRWSNHLIVNILSPQDKSYEEEDYGEKEADHAQDQRSFTFTI
jgi:hypothetical protein